MTRTSWKPAPILACTALVLATLAAPSPALAQRQYYDTTWSYSSSSGYYYTTYYYQTSYTTTTYSHHYCIYYPSRPSYVYYYNPVSQAYWGRYEIGSTGDKRYSKLDKKDQKKDVEAIPESAFPTASKMPSIPDSQDNVAMAPPPEKTIPKDKPTGDQPADKKKGDLPGDKGGSE